MAHSVIITRHARERWVERIIDPKRYDHYRLCRVGCPTCVDLAYDMMNTIRIAGRGIDRDISQRFRSARPVEDQVFLKAVGQTHDLASHAIKRDDKAVFVTLKAEIPVLGTVMSIDMMTGTIIRNNSGNNLKNVFSSWKHEVKAKTFKQPMRRL